MRATVLEVGVRWPPETFVRRKLQGLAREGFRVVVASPVPRGEDTEPIEGLELVRLPHWHEPTVHRVFGLARDMGRMIRVHPRRFAPALVAAWRGRYRDGAYRWRRSLFAARRIFAAGRLDADVIHFEWESAAVQYFDAALLLGRPVTMSCRGGDIDIACSHTEAGFSRAVREVFGRATLVHCVSLSTMRTAARHGLDTSKARVIRPAVDTERFRPKRPTVACAEGSAPLRIVSLGLLRWRKGWEYLLDAVALLAERDIPVRLDIIGAQPGLDHGEPSESLRIRHAIEECGLDGVVRLLGERDEESVRHLLREADVVLHAGLAEGIPNVALEAMASAVPVVIADVGGTSEAVRDGIDGFVVPPRDSRALADACAVLWSDRELRERMGRAGRCRVVAEFALERQIAQWVDFQLEAINGVPR